MVIPDFARNLISVGRLNENGNEFVSRKDESELKNPSGDTMKFEKETDGMTYLKARRVSFEREALMPKELRNEATKPSRTRRMKPWTSMRRIENLDMRRKKWFGACLKRLVSNLREWAVCDGCARAKATQKRTNKITTTEAEERGERLYMDTSGPYNETVAGSRYWFKIVDDKTKSWDFYGAKKSGIKRTFKNFWTN
ncbi:hypothetical protein MHU86_21414 [Fragilaria crotonensis]|nr:hypothetical protein MHU86_21414 [Fragilaria crotonensis]